MSEREWIRDGHYLYWDEDGPMLEHPNKCPYYKKKSGTLRFTIYECIPGIEEIEVGFSEKSYMGPYMFIPWDNPFAIEGRVEIEWYYWATWVDGLVDEYDSEFKWREVQK